MTIFHSFILGLVEGLTEFLPISSTAHLILVSYLLKIPQDDFLKLFEVLIQSGAILAIFFLYVRYLLRNKFLWSNIITSFFPTVIVGFFSYKIIKNIFFSSINLILFSLFSLGLVFILTEFLISKKKLILKKELSQLNLRESLIIGLFQSLAVIPGVSRSGSVILIMIFLGYKRKDSAVYSFLLAIPTILAASIYDLYKNIDLIFDINISYLIIGFFTSFIFSVISVNWFVDFLQKKNLVLFGWYRIILAIFLFFLLRLVII